MFGLLVLLILDVDPFLCETGITLRKAELFFGLSTVLFPMSRNEVVELCLICFELGFFKWLTFKFDLDPITDFDKILLYVILGITFLSEPTAFLLIDGF